jgi:hypothetical protein
MFNEKWSSFDTNKQFLHIYKLFSKCKVMYKVYHTSAQVKLEVIPARGLRPCTMTLVLFPAQQFAHQYFWRQWVK